MTTPRPIVITPYDDGWPAEFERVRSQLAETLGDVAERVDHIGSTSVPGLPAKDIIDVQIAVRRLDDPRLMPALERLGCASTDITRDHVPADDPGDEADWEKRYFRPPAHWRPTHLHVRETGRANFRYPLLFRDYLRHAPAAVTTYAEIKRQLARLHPDDADAYYAVKDPVCDLVMDAAEQWAWQTGWRP